MRRETVWRMLARHTRADGALVMLAVLVVAVVTVMVALLPAIQRDAADEAVRAAAAQPGSDAVVTVPVTRDYPQLRVLWPDTAQTTEYMADTIHQALPDSFAAPVTTIVSPALVAGRDDGVELQMRLAYVDGANLDSANPDSGSDEPVEWIAGRAPGATAGAMELVNDQSLRPVVEVGLSVASAKVWGVGAGDQLDVEGPEHSTVTVRVSGIFAQLGTGADLVPQLVEPQVVGGGNPRVVTAALLSDESLPFARYVLPPGALSRTFTASPRIDRINAADAPALVREVRALATAREGIRIPDERPVLRTSIDGALEQALGGVRESVARTAVVLAGVMVAAAFLLVLGARELVERRARALSLLRSRGAGAPAIGGVFAVESAAVAGVGVGLAGAAAAGLSQTSLGARPEVSAAVWVPAIVALVAPPVIAMATAVWGSGVSGGGAHGAHGARRARRRAAMRVAGEVIVVALAIVGALTLRSRGAEAAANSIGADAPVLAAPALAAVVAGLVAVRLLPVLRAAVMAVAKRATGAVGVLVAARSGLAPMATYTVVVATAMVAVTAWSGAGLGLGLGDGSGAGAGGGVGAGGDSGEAVGAVPDAVPDAVAEPLARAESLTSIGALAALALISVLAVVVSGAGARRRGALSVTRVRVLGMAAGPARWAAAIAAAWPIVVSAVIAVVAGAVIAVLVLGVDSAQVVAVWPLLGLAAWPVVLGVIAAVVAALPGAGERRSLGERMRAF